MSPARPHLVATDSWSKRLAELVSEEAGLDLSRCRAADAHKVLETVAREMGLSGAGAVLEAARGPQSPAIVERLLSVLLVHETFFHRYAAQLDVLEQRILPSLLAEGPRKLRLWSAGCSSGPEAYNLAMIAMRARDSAGSRCDVEVIGTDVSPQALDVARRGTYPATTVADLPVDLRDRYLDTIDGGRFRVGAILAHSVRFQKHNLRSRPPAGRFHVISCRNVLMYLQDDTARAAVAHLASALEPTGVLAVGHGESLRSFGEMVAPDRETSVNLYRHAPKRVGTLRTAVRSAAGPPSSTSTRTRTSAGSGSGSGSGSGVRKIVLRGIYDGRNAPEAVEALRKTLAQVVERGARVEIDADRATSLDGTTAMMIGRAVRAAPGRIVVKAQRPSVRRWALRYGLPLA